MLISTIFDIKNYNIYRKDKQGQRAPGGGVAIWVRKFFMSSDSTVDFFNSCGAHETMWCEVKCKGGRDIVLG